MERTSRDVMAIRQTLRIRARDYITPELMEIAGTIAAHSEGIYPVDRVKPILSVGETVILKGESDYETEISTLENLRRSLTELQWYEIRDTHGRYIISADKMFSDSNRCLLRDSIPKNEWVDALILYTMVNFGREYIPGFMYEMQDEDYIDGLLIENMSEKPTITNQKLWVGTRIVVRDNTARNIFSFREKLKEACSLFLHELNRFIGEDDFAIYRLIYMSRMFIIYKCGDYHAYLYLLDKETEADNDDGVDIHDLPALGNPMPSPWALPPRSRRRSL